MYLLRDLRGESHSIFSSDVEQVLGPTPPEERNFPYLVALLGDAGVDSVSVRSISTESAAREGAALIAQDATAVAPDTPGAYISVIPLEDRLSW